MLIYVKTQSGHTFNLNIHKNHTIYDVKKMIQEQEGIKIKQQRLLVDDKILDNAVLLKQFRTKSKNIFHLFLLLVRG